MPKTKAVTWNEIDELIELISEKQVTGTTAFPDKTYEDGIRAAIEWVTGMGDAHPLDKE